MNHTVGKYRLIREIGKGATATVYLAEDPERPGTELALKLIDFSDRTRDEGKWSRRLRKLLRAEWSVVQRLDHPNIIKIFDTVIEEDRAYLVMEYFSGTTLEHYCSFERLLPLHRVVSAVFKCCLALDYAHRAGIVHRDIKPANILINDDDIKVTDFGLALNLSRKDETDSTFIMGVGSPAYMSPEQIKSYPLNHKTDLYSLGVVLFHLLCGRLPFRARNPAQLIYKIINTEPPRVSLLNPDVPERMDAIISRALEKDLYSRYRNGMEFAKDLTGVRYRIVEEDRTATDLSRFAQLRRLSFFVEFDDEEVWEMLRTSVWRRVAADTLLLREGESETRFGILVEGEVELSLGGRRVLQLGPGDAFGELASLDTLPDAQPAKLSFSAITLAPVSYLEINTAALALATEECRDNMQQRLVSMVARRFASLCAEVASHAGGAAQARRQEIMGFELGLVGDPPPAIMRA